MADPNIQSLIYPVSIGPGLIKTYQTDVNKQTGSSVTYDISNLGQKDAVWRSEREVAPDGKVFYRANPVQSSYYENLSDTEKKFIQTDVAYQADNQRAAFIQTNYTQDQINNLFPNMPRVRNTAPPSQSVTPGGSTTEPVEPSRDPAIDPSVDSPTTIDPSTITIGESSGRRDFGTYAYPYDLRTNTQDRIIFTLKEIKGSKITPTFNKGEKVIKRNELTSIAGSVTLPIQSGITDSNSVDWSGSSLNAIQAYAAGASLTFMGSEDAGELGNNVSNILGKIAQKIKGNTDYGNALKLYLAQEAVGINGLLSRASGAILNPNLELLFNGPQLRPFNFTFRLSPREEKEATEVRSIIRFFKEAMSVRTSSDNIFLKSPLVFDIKYITYGDDGKPLKNHPSIGRIKTCALLSCDVDYTPDGTYMTFNDGSRTMTSYGLSLRFSELDPIYNTDYYDSENKNNNIPVDNIGF